jgi:AcrR family transcriptional regulator
MTHAARADKELNRIRLTEAASRALRRDGVGVSMRAIARESGMGIATVYRHFPTRNDLIEAVLTTQVHECTDAIRAALNEPDPWSGLQSVIDWFAELQIAHPGLLRVLLELPASDAPFMQARREHGAALDRLVTDARSSGAVRPDVTTSDVRVGMMSMTAFSGKTGISTAVAVRALRTILIRGVATVR